MANHLYSSDQKGSYLLLFRLEEDQSHITIGKLGTFDFVAGCYLYVGSAFGSGGLAARLRHHQKRHKPRPHWHIDYLRPHLQLTEIWVIAGPLKLEHSWCRALTNIPDTTIPVPRFGASDSTCAAHLFYRQKRPSTSNLFDALFDSVPFDHPNAQNLSIEVHPHQETAS
jgi:Uri superfamily endonuclease